MKVSAVTRVMLVTDVQVLCASANDWAGETKVMKWRLQGVYTSERKIIHQLMVQFNFNTLGMQPVKVLSAKKRKIKYNLPIDVYMRLADEEILSTEEQQIIN